MSSLPPAEIETPLSIEAKAQRGDALETGALPSASPPSAGKLPAIIDAPALPAEPTGRSWLRRAILVVLIGAGAAGGFFYWRHFRAPPLPAGIVFGNGRIDAEEIDIDTKFAGRVAQLYVEEGDMVKAGQIIARMDTQDFEATLKKDDALVRQNEHLLMEAQANVAQLESQLKLAQQELDRTSALLKRGYATRELYDQRLQAFNGTSQGLIAARARAIQASHALEAAQHDVELVKVNIADNTLVAPRAGRVQYRIAEPGEVLAAGGKVFTMLDIGDVYMAIYLPTLDAGRVKIGADARIVLDAYPEHPIRAKVTFLATQAQFTPKAVETKSERDKLMFRVKVRIDPDILTKYAESLRTGLPGNAYIRVDQKVEWPDWLRSRPASDS
ncbi:HlyD family secretion protein [Methylocapsa acidiphila]|uniref:HlyD family secretion protein n=1 Tax=Methylocapsa acidiphila TaxID=133552 RepID=UPI001FD9B910|nr:HlyD family efflux transporter periplasmic adaptor subunit [Methylocapsa acidiphila]